MSGGWEWDLEMTAGQNRTQVLEDPYVVETPPRVPQPPPFIVFFVVFCLCCPL